MKQPTAACASESPARTADQLALWLVLAVTAAYLLHAITAVVNHRHLYGDAAWYLVRMASEGTVTSHYSNLLRELHHTRLFSFWLTQSPAVVAIRLGVRNLDALSWIFGATYFLHRPLSVLICYCLLPPGKKLLAIFPILSLFAGTIASDIYIVTETHVAASFFWPILFAIEHRPRLSPAVILCVSVGLVLSTLIFEAWAFLAGAVALAIAFRWRVHEPGERRPLLLFAGLTVLVAVANWAAILFPRDAVNKGAFLKGLLLVLHDASLGLAHVHLGPTMSILAVLGVAVALVWPHARERGSWFVLVPLSSLLAVGPALHFAAYAHTTDFGNAITDRGFGGFVMQVGLAAAYLVVRTWLPDAWVRSARRTVVVVAALAFGQTSWQLLATNAWATSMAALRNALTTQRGPVNCAGFALEHPMGVGVPVDKVLCSWWVAPLSLVLAPSPRIRSVLFDSSSRFQAFDVRAPKRFPALFGRTPAFDGYQEALAAQTNLTVGLPISFSAGGFGTGLLRSGFAEPEPWGTWTLGATSNIAVCGLREARGPIDMRFRVAAFTAKAKPVVQTTLSAGGEKLGVWDFGLDEGIVERRILVPKERIDGAGCLDLEFSISDFRSPAEVGVGGDYRPLGIALVQLTVTPA